MVARRWSGSSGDSIEAPESLHIRTDNKWHDFKYAYEVPASVMKREFDWINPEEDVDGFILYRGGWYHLSQFMRGGAEGWDGVHNTSMTTGVLIKVSKDGEQYKIGTYRV